MTAGEYVYLYDHAAMMPDADIAAALGTLTQMRRDDLYALARAAGVLHRFPPAISCRATLVRRVEDRRHAALRVALAKGG